MHSWEQIQHTIDFIDEHLYEDMQIEALANLAGLSQFYYQRLFCKLVKKPVAEYIKLRRMTKAADLLLSENSKTIMEVALECGFTSHENFSRTFKTAFGITPTDYRKCTPTLNRMVKPNLMLNYTLVEEGVPLISDGMVFEIHKERIETPICFTGLSMDVPLQVMQELGAGTGVDPLDELWNQVHTIKEKLGIPSNSEELGVALASKLPDCFCYFAGTIGNLKEIKNLGNSLALKKDLSEKLTTYNLEEGEYVVCTFEADCFQSLVMDSLYKAQQYLYNVWLPNHQLQTAPFAAERYPSHSPETTNMEVWLKLI